MHNFMMWIYSFLCLAISFILDHEYAPLMPEQFSNQLAKINKLYISDNNRYSPISYKKYLKYWHYWAEFVDKPKPYDVGKVAQTKLEAVQNNALIGDALGFLTEDLTSFQEIIDNFPIMISDAENTCKMLKKGKVKTKFGQYNNNNLKQGKLSYSDDTDLSQVTLKVVERVNRKLITPDDFFKTISVAFTNHWYKLFSSGEYGYKGTLWGPRGYGHNTLNSLSRLRHECALSLCDIEEKYKEENKGNGGLIRSWPVAFLETNNYMDIVIQAMNQTLVTHCNPTALISSAVFTVGIYYSLNSTSTKYEILEKMKYIALLLESHFYKDYVHRGLVQKYKNYAQDADLVEKKFGAKKGIYTKDDIYIYEILIIAEEVAREGVHPILFFNNFIGYRSDEALAAVVYSFLSNNNVEQAILNAVFSPGDSDSMASMIGAFLGAYYSVYPNNYLPYIESIKKY